MRPDVFHSTLACNRLASTLNRQRLRLELTASFGSISNRLSCLFMFFNSQIVVSEPPGTFQQDPLNPITEFVVIDDN